MNEELKACPFCKGTNVRLLDELKKMQAECPDCMSIMGWYDTIEEAVKHWQPKDQDQ